MCQYKTNFTQVMKSASGGWLLYKATGMICTLTQRDSFTLSHNADSFVNAISFVYVHFNRLALTVFFSVLNIMKR